ncbi:NAD(P)H-binding protein [Nakamurella sp. YIM 132087]|uniref:NAD(P)H-binding protein n=1 Tax=Nakamurella alba TaxID=2665158 RepID=A0A7K1FL74_9ACTN|nr:NAD(P)H-binding protein [Nakamurella alba]MTD14858.1 NAD(P)H-binding protein [Nakamurella alba]
MRIAVTTPTGNVGSRLTELLLQAGVRPVLLLRDAGKLPDHVRELADVHEGDLDDAGFVRTATEGVDALYWVSPEDLMAEDPNALTEARAGHAAAAIRANGIRRVVVQSSVGAEKKHGAGLIDGLARAEEQLTGTDAQVRILRCGYFFTNLLMDPDAIGRGEIITVGATDVPMPWVAPDDIAVVAAVSLLSTEWTTDVQAVHGPEDISWQQAADILADVLGHPFRVLTPTPEEQQALMEKSGVPTGAARGLIEMTTGLADLVPEQPRTPLTTTPTTLAEWAVAHLRPASAPAP